MCTIDQMSFHICSSCGGEDGGGTSTMVPVSWVILVGVCFGGSSVRTSNMFVVEDADLDPGVDFSLQSFGGMMNEESYWINTNVLLITC